LPFAIFLLEVLLPGKQLSEQPLFVTAGRDLELAFQLVDEKQVPVVWPAGELFLEVGGERWPFTVDGSVVSLKVESEDVDGFSARARWQIAFLPEGELDGGQPVAIGSVRRQR
jgi:hypothetical protein